LSANRADTACRALNQRHLARPPKIIAHGHTDPIAANSNEAGRQENRRVAITVILQAKT
jgi:flagellar motor protein MotB